MQEERGRGAGGMVEGRVRGALLLPPSSHRFERTTIMAMYLLKPLPDTGGGVCEQAAEHAHTS